MDYYCAENPSLLTSTAYKKPPACSLSCLTTHAVNRFVLGAPRTRRGDTLNVVSTLENEARYAAWVLLVMALQLGITSHACVHNYIWICRSNVASSSLSKNSNSRVRLA